MTIVEKILNDVEFKSLFVQFVTAEGEPRTVFVPKGSEVISHVAKSGDTFVRMDTSDGWKSANASLIMGVS